MVAEENLHIAGTAPRELFFGKVLKVLTGGNHHPLLCELEDKQGPAGYWTVKPQDVMSTGNVRNGALNIMAELVGAEVCAWAGIRTPALGIVRFPDEPIDIMYESVDKEWRSEVATVFKTNRKRLAFCCRFLNGAIDLDSEILKYSGRAIAEKWGPSLFAVDVYIRHDDRRESNPNALIYQSELVAIDHGAAFAGIDRPGTTGRSLAEKTVVQAPTSYAQHVFYRALSKFTEPIAWESIADRLASVSDKQIDDAAAGWPDELNPHKALFVEFVKVRRDAARQLLQNASRLITPTDGIGGAR